MQELGCEETRDEEHGKELEIARHARDDVEPVLRVLPKCVTEPRANERFQPEEHNEIERNDEDGGLSHFVRRHVGAQHLEESLSG